MTAPAPSGTNASQPVVLDGATRRVTIGVLALQVEKRLEACSAHYTGVQERQYKKR